MHIIRNRKFCYLASPRTASKATAGLLMAEFGAELIGSHHSYEPGIVDNSWTICTTVRNHWDTVVSWYWKTHPKQHTFYEFLELWLGKDKYCQNHRLFPHLNNVNKILRYEKLQNDFNSILSTTKTLPVIIDTKRNDQDYRVFYTDKTRKIVAEYFKDEITFLGYSYD